MLVLVLILVVIALALVLAAFFLHLVVLAWTSVGISLLAFLVLSYDWWQTRSAVRAGRQAGVGARDDGGDRPISGGAAAGAVGAGAGGAGAVGAYGSGGVADADMEPATQVLPIVPPQSNAAEETIVMPVVAPSGVSETPSGESRSGGLSSPNVTTITSDDSGSERPGDDGTTAVDPAAGPEPGSGGDPATGTAAPDAGDRTGSDGEAERPAGAGAVVAGAAAGTAAGGAVSAVAGNGRPREAEPSGAEQASARGSGTGQTGADQARSEQTRVTEAGRGQSADPAQAPSGAAPDGARRADGDRATDAGRTTAVTVGAATDLPVEATTQNPAQQAGTQQGASRQATTQQAQQPPVQQQAAAQATQQIDTSGEAPEEPRDPTLASLVARLPDEVVVIDERPRYHVQGCPSLPGQPVIPLPVSEAVELGFTPCGWCSPNRALGERHPAEVR